LFRNPPPDSRGLIHGMTDAVLFTAVLSEIEG
jgi:hypothetical protein